MSRAGVELDFFGMEKGKSSPATSKSLDRRRSFRGIQSAISKINPELLKSVITSSASFSAPPTPMVEHNALPPLPIYVPVPRPANAAAVSSEETAPMTIFYNGTVAVFDLSPEKADYLLKLVAEANSKAKDQENKYPTTDPSTDKQQLFGTLGGDLPIFRRKSLQTFLEKRKERLTCMSPYACEDHDGVRSFREKTGTAAGDKFDV